MEHIIKLQRFQGVDIGFGNNIHPSNGEGCVGKAGINKDYSLSQVIELAHKMEEKPNVIIKGGQNAKWYIKKINPDDIHEAIEKNSWRDVSRCTMYVIEWDE
jgi:hypothetical protein